ncbi:SAM-dependent methyltransferase [Plantactinospora sp. KLBMP9567]|uniref:SAM-dependent methyltransferase n=1 Tax=Plantactinospora sp. KLBMP9567 TaxID=3085900 RepID=UPI002981043B|nr:SAM-dependent methyltransferase [Plantactinospora sp. KLBMP9567]MDW5326654.1 SAM-dependent methyltransferase [Plantactinospora sp. KLBMP9567]
MTKEALPVDRGWPDGLDTGVPHSARIWNYWMGGKDHFAADREAGDAYRRQFPGIVPLAKQSRRFLIRAVHHLAAEAGIRNFLDIGTGLPTLDNTHQVAQRAAPESRIVYVDNDPLVLTHARALLSNTTPEGVTGYVDADLHDPDQIIADARNILNFTQPIAVMFMGVLGHVADHEEARSIVARVMASVPSGSYLVLWDSTNTTEGFDEAQQGYDDTGAVPYVLRSPEQIERCFDGLTLLEPGIVSISRWRPESPDAEPVDGFGGIGRKP